MSRPRKTLRDPHGNLLLPRMSYRHGAYYLSKPDTRLIHLGRDFVTALQQYTLRIAPNGDDAMKCLIEEWRKDRLPAYAEKTRADYGRMLDGITEAFSEFNVAEVKPADVYTFCKQWKDKPRSANAYRSLLAMLFTYGASTDWPNDNPAIHSLTFKPEPKRDRYLTDSEIVRIKHGALTGKDARDNASGPMVCAFIDLALITAQRVGDLLALEWTDVSEAGVYFHPSKTVNSTGVRLLIETSPRLAEVLDRLGRAKHGPVIHRQDGEPFTYSGLQTAWRRARDRAKVRNAHIHDLRAKALTDMESAKEAQALAGHATEGMTAHYRKARTVTKVKAAQ